MIEPPAPVKARAAAPAPSRTWLFVGIGVAVAVLFVIGLFVAYQAGKGHKAEATGGSAPTNPDGAKAPADADPPGPMPGAGNVIHAPAQVADKVGEVQTVEFKVRSIGGTTYLELNSHMDAGAPDRFAVRVAAEFFKAPPDREKVRQEFEGKTIRVRGKIQRDPQAGLHIDVDSPRQIVPVER